MTKKMDDLDNKIDRALSKIKSDIETAIEYAKDHPAFVMKHVGAAIAGLYGIHVWLDRRDISQRLALVSEQIAVVESTLDNLFLKSEPRSHLNFALRKIEDIIRVIHRSKAMPLETMRVDPENLMGRGRDAVSQAGKRKEIFRRILVQVTGVIMNTRAAGDIKKFERKLAATRIAFSLNAALDRSSKISDIEHLISNADKKIMLANIRKGNALRSKVNDYATFGDMPKDLQEEVMDYLLNERDNTEKITQTLNKLQRSYGR